MGIATATAEVPSRRVFQYRIPETCIEIARRDILVDRRRPNKIPKAIAKDTQDYSENIRRSISMLTIEMSKPAALAKCDDIRTGRFLSDTTFFHTLGFDVIESVDAGRFEGANCIHDFNEESLRHKPNRSFDSTAETEMAEHIFHIKNYLEDISASIQNNGYIAHFMSSNNDIDHRLYQPPPILFYDFYTANWLEIVEFLLLTTKSTDWERFDVLPHRPGEYDHLTHNRFKVDCAFLAILIRKTQDSGFDVIPQQQISTQRLN